MKFFRHYKNKPYKYVGEAVHSETQEPVVIYETRYPNDRSKLWVRPKNMFFENVLVDGVEQERFAPVPLEIREFTELGSQEIKIVASFMHRLFGEWNEARFRFKLQQHSKLHLAIGFVDSEPVGFKLGYAIQQTEFHSWLGGVLPDFRGLGVASDLMIAQHAWCRSNGFTSVRTKTLNSLREMLVLNIRFGFEIIGLETVSGREPRILLEKKLSLAERT